MAGNGVNVKMGVSGVAQFKQNMNQAKQAVKTLDAQLALSEKQFKQTGDSQGYMAEKGALLEAKLENQKKILAEAQKALEDMASKGIDKSSKAYQDMYRTMIEAKGAIIDTENAMNGVTDAGDKAADGVSEMNAQLKAINKGVSFQNVTEGIGKITSAANDAIKKAVALGKAIVNEVLGAGTWADDLATRAQFYGLTEEELQRMEKTAALIDTPVEAIISARKKLKKELAGEKEADMGAWAALGINPNDARDSEDLLWRTGEAIMRLTDESKQENYAQQLLGRSWNELIPLFEAGRAEYEKTKDSWNVVPQKQLDNLKEMNDQYETLKAELETVKMTFMGTLAPAVTSVLGTLTSLMEKFNEYLASPEGQKAMEALGDAITKLVDDLVNVDPDAVVNGISKAIEGIKEAFEWIEQNKDAVKTALLVIGGGFAAMNMANFATNVWSAVNGMRQLGGGGNTPVVTPTPTPAVNPTTTAAAAGGGTAATTKAGFWAGAKAGLGTVGAVAGELALFAVAADAVYDSYMFVKEGLEKGQQSIDKFSKMKELYGDYSWFGDLSNLYGYQHIREKGEGSGEAFAGMDAFSREWEAWLNDEKENPLFERTLKLMPQETFDRFVEAMDLYSKNPNLDAQEMEEQVFNPLNEGLAVMEEAAAELAGEGVGKVKDAGDDISDAADRMEKLPAETAEAVKEALSDVRIYIDGDALAGSVGGIMAGNIIRFGA